MGPADSSSAQSAAPFIPQTGAAKYWYVDPSASRNFNPMAYADEQGHNGNDRQAQELMQLQEALRRIGALPSGTTPSF